jgi:hypothetical protein
MENQRTPMQDLGTEMTIDSRLLFLVLRELNPHKTQGYYYFTDDLKEYLQKKTQDIYWVNWKLEDSEQIRITQEGENLRLRLIGGHSESFQQAAKIYTEQVPDEYKVFLSSTVTLDDLFKEKKGSGIKATDPRRLSQTPHFFSTKCILSNFATDTRYRRTSSSSLLITLGTTKGGINFEDPTSIKEALSSKNATIETYSLVLLHALVNSAIFDEFQESLDKKIPEHQKPYLKHAKDLFMELSNKKQKLMRVSSKQKSEHSRTQSKLINAGSGTLIPSSFIARLRKSPEKADGQNRRRSSLVLDLEPTTEILSKSLDIIEDKIILNALNYVIDQSKKEFEFPLKAFKSFGENKKLSTKLFSRPALLYNLLSSDNKILGDNLISLLEACFEFDEYNPQSDTEDYKDWIKFFIRYIYHFRCIPEFFCAGSGSLKFLMTMSSEQIKAMILMFNQYGLKTALAQKILSRIREAKDLRLAGLLLKKSHEKVSLLLEEHDEACYYYTLLSLGHKRIDLALLKKQEFLTWIVKKESVIGRYMYAQLLERLKSAFDYKNLPTDGEMGSEKRQTQCLETMDNSGQECSNSKLQFQFLSREEITSVFNIDEVSVPKTELYKKWLELYLKNLSLILSRFLPHLENHLNNISRIYEAYVKKTIGSTASGGDIEKYNPDQQALNKFPEEMVQYILDYPDDMSEFNANIEKMKPLFSEMKQLAAKKIDEEGYGNFIPATRLAKDILKQLTSVPRLLDDNQLARLISERIIAYFQNCLEMEPAPCSKRTVIDIHTDKDQILWFQKALLNELLKRFTQSIKSLCKRSEKDLKDNFFSEELVCNIVDDFCQKKWSVVTTTMKATRKEQRTSITEIKF